MRLRRNVIRRFLSAAAVLLALPAVLSAQGSGIESLRTQLEESYEFLKCDNNERGAAVIELFRSKGTKPEEIVKNDVGNAVNFSVEVKGKSDSIVIVGAHYDSVSDGCGAIDNWSGIVMLANLYGRIRTNPGEKTFRFVAFGNEEKGLLGSRMMAKSIPREDRERYCAMVNIDSFGMFYPQAATNLSSMKLVELSEEVAKKMGIPFHKASLNGRSDSISFMDVDIPSITLHGLGKGYEKLIHTRDDTKKNVNVDSLAAGYLLSTRILAEIDSRECGTFR